MSSSSQLVLLRQPLTWVWMHVTVTSGVFKYQLNSGAMLQRNHHATIIAPVQCIMWSGHKRPRACCCTAICYVTVYMP